MSPLVLLLPVALWLLSKAEASATREDAEFTPVQSDNPKVAAARKNLADVTHRVRREAQYARAGSAQYELNLMDLANARRDLDEAIAASKAT